VSDAADVVTLDRLRCCFVKGLGDKSPQFRTKHSFVGDWQDAAAQRNEVLYEVDDRGVCEERSKFTGWCVNGAMTDEIWACKTKKV
jgi:hypothetical protein